MHKIVFTIAMSIN